VGTLVSLAQDTIPLTDTSIAPTNPILPKTNNLFSARLSFTSPNPISNKAFNKSFVGIYQVDGSMNMSLYKGIYVGVAFSYASLKINKNLTGAMYNVGLTPAQTNEANASMSIYNAAIKIGGDFYIGEKNRMILSPAISVGQSYVKYSSFVCKDSAKHIQITDFKSPYVQTDISMIFLIEPNWGIGPTISYSLIKRNFDPTELCLEDWGVNKSNSSATQYF